MTMKTFALYLIRLLSVIAVCRGHGGGENLLTTTRGQRTFSDLEEASEWLASIGIQGLCHPTLSTFDPFFPRCNQGLSAAFNDKESKKILHRHLEEPNSDQINNYNRAYYYNDNDSDSNNDDAPKLSQLDYIYNGCMSLLCVVLGAVASGLTVGLLSLDPLLLVIKMRGSPSCRERQYATTLLPLVQQHHQLLVTLLLLNTMASESLPLFLQVMMPGSVAVLVSVGVVLLFGEILPTALFVGPNQLYLASRLAPFVKVLIWLLYPIAYPIAKLLDHVLLKDHEDGGGGGTTYHRGELAALIRVQYEERLHTKQRRRHERQASLATIHDMNLDASDVHPPVSDVRVLRHELNSRHRHQQSEISLANPPSLDGDEVIMMEGALQMKTKRAMDILVSYHKVFSIPIDMELNDANIFSIYASGYSRVPVFIDNNRQLVKGILMTRQLMVVNQINKNNRESQEAHAPPSKRVSDLALHVPQCVAPHTNLLELVNLFQTGGSAIRAGHMALVCARPDVANDALEKDLAVPEKAGLMGIITLEDVLEALLQEQIYDEMDAAGRMPAVDAMEPVSEAGEYQLA